MNMGGVRDGQGLIPGVYWSWFRLKGSISSGLQEPDSDSGTQTGSAKLG